MKKIIKVTLLIVILFFIYRFLHFKYKDYVNCNKCDNSEFVADGGRFDITFITDDGKIKDLKDLKDFSINLKTNLGILKKIKFDKDLSKSNLFHTNDKISKSDTLIVKVLKDKEFKVYDFKNDAIRINAGKNKGEYYCILHYKINSKEMDGDNIGGNGIIINTK